MRTPTDALRSLKRYVAASLGPEWEVRLSADDDGAEFHRPFARCRSTTPGTLTARSATQVEYRQSYSVLCYPAIDQIPAAVDEAREPTAEEARMEAARVEELLFQALMVGTHAASYGTQAISYLPGTVFKRGHSKRIPLFDYEGVALDAPVDEDARDPRDFMRIEGDPTISILTDPNDPLSVVVAAELRMSWVRFAAVASPGMTVADVTATPEGG